MTRLPLDGGTGVMCVICEAVIPEQRLLIVPDAKLCVACQDKVERGIVSLEAHLMGKEKQANEPEIKPIEVQEDRLVTGAWSAGFMELATQSSQMRDLLREGKKEDARALVQTMPVEAQAALVVLDEDPEEALSITGMGEDGRPGYSTAVVAHLPTEMLAGLIAYDADRQSYNTQLIKAMAPDTFSRTVEETLDPMDNAEARSKVSFEWLRALAALEDSNKCAELLRSVDPELLEEALIPHVTNLKMNDTAKTVEISGMSFSISKFRFFSEEGAVGLQPSALVEDATVGRVLDALYEADAELMRYIIRGAWERVD